MAWTIKRTVDLQKGDLHQNGKQVGILSFPGDEDAHIWEVTVLDGGEPATLSGTVTAYFMRSYDGNSVVATGSYTGNVVSVAIPAGAYAYQGLVTAILRLTVENESTVTIDAIAFSVGENHTGTIVDPGEVIDVDDILALYDDMQAATDACEAATTGLTGMTGDMNLESLASIQDTYVNSSGVETANDMLRCSNYIRVPNNAVYAIVANKTTKDAQHIYHIIPCVVFYDSNKQIIGYSSNSTDDIVRERIPENTAYMRVNQSVNQDDYWYVGYEFLSDDLLGIPIATFTGSFTAKQVMNTGIRLMANEKYVIKCSNIPLGRISVYNSANSSFYKSFTPWRSTVVFQNGASTGTLCFYNSQDTRDTMVVSVYKAGSMAEKYTKLPTEYIVDVSNSSFADYSSLTACLLDLKDDRSEKIIYINGGDYNIYQEYVNANVPVYTGSNPSADYWDYNVFIPQNTHIIGRGLVRLIWMPTSQQVTVNQSKTVSPVNVAGSMTLENVEIHCQNGRYCIHDDPLGHAEFTNAIKKYINVKCYKYANDTGYGFAPVIGFGIDSQMSYLFENCLFKNLGNERAFYMHNRATVGGASLSKANSSNIRVNNCILDSGSSTMIAKFGNTGNSSAQRIRVEFNGCSLNNNANCTIYAINEGSGDTLPNTFDITLNRCSPNAQVSVADTSNPYPPLIVQ